MTTSWLSALGTRAWRNALPIAAVLALCTFGVAMAQSYRVIDGKAKAQLAGGTKIIFRKTNIAAGDYGRGGTTVTNRSKKARTKVTLTQARPVSTNAALASNLLLSVHDDTTNRCYWPRARRGACRGMGRWVAPQLRKIVILSKKKKQYWVRRERHKFTVQWRLGAAAPNAAQGGSSQFQLVWKAT
jgi:hypothetical protein